MKAKLYAILGVALAIIAVVLFVLYLFNVVNFPLADWLAYFLFIIGGVLVGISEKLSNQNESLFKQLIYVAAADGNLTQEELMTIGQYAKQFGVSESKLKTISEELKKGQFQLVIPEKTSDKEKNIKAMIKMANADGNIDSKELALIKEVAKKYSLGEDFVDSLI